MQPVVIVHGGAGPRRRAGAERIDGQRLAALEHAVRTACANLGDGALAACVAAVAELEDCPLFNAGTGSALASDGTVCCDAAVMTGAGRAGAVAAVTGIRHPVRAARALLDEGEMVLWAGHSGELIARHGLTAIDPRAHPPGSGSVALRADWGSSGWLARAAAGGPRPQQGGQFSTGAKGSVFNRP